MTRMQRMGSWLASDTDALQSTRDSMRARHDEQTWPRSTARGESHLYSCYSCYSCDPWLDPYFCFSSQSFWKAGSLRKGSQIGSSLNSAGVTGARK